MVATVVATGAMAIAFGSFQSFLAQQPQLTVVLKLTAVVAMVIATAIAIDARRENSINCN